MRHADPDAPVTVIGASGHARVIVDILEREGRRIAGLLDAARESGTTFAGHPVLGDHSEERLRAADALLVAIGDNGTRSQVARAAAGVGAAFATAVHPSATVAPDATVGPGTVIMAGAVVNPGVRIGPHVVVNTRASVDHDCRLDEFCSVAPGATLGGGVHVGASAAVGIGATVLHGVQIGARTVLGAGAVALDDLPELSVAYGIPARVVRPRTEDEPYL